MKLKKKICSIRKINPTSVNWHRRANSRSKFMPLHNRIWTMPVNSAVKVEFGYPVKHINVVLQNFRKNRIAKKGFSIQTKRLDSIGKVWAIRKDRRTKR